MTILRPMVWEMTQFIGDGWILAELKTIYLNHKADLMLDPEQFDHYSLGLLNTLVPYFVFPPLTDSKLYRDIFLTGVRLNDTSNFNEWIFVESESLLRNFASILNLLVEDFQFQQVLV